MLVRVPEIDTSTDIFGTKVSFPLGFSPTALHRFAHPDGEKATSRAAANMGVGMALSSYSTTSLEDVAAQGTGRNPYAMQLTIPKERGFAVQMVKRAEGIYLLWMYLDCRRWAHCPSQRPATRPSS